MMSTSICSAWRLNSGESHHTEAWRGMEREVGAISGPIELLQWAIGSSKGASRMKYLHARHDILMADQIQNDRVTLKIIGDCFTPNGHGVSTYITKKFKERQSTTGHSWKNVDQQTKDFYFKEFVKKYTWEPGHETKFKEIWNLYCRKRYKSLLYKWRKIKTKSSHIPDDLWAEWKKSWAIPRWKNISTIARNNRNSESVGKHTGGSRSSTEHALVMEDTLQRPTNCWELFRSTHRRKDGTFVDDKSQSIDDQMAEKVAHASQQSIEGGDLQTPSHTDINNLYYEVVGGSKKNSLYGLSSHAKVVFDMSTPRLKGASSSTSHELEQLRKENEYLRQKFTALEESIEDRVNQAVEQSMQAFIARFMPSQPLTSPFLFPTPRGIASQETQDPNNNDGGNSP